MPAIRYRYMKLVRDLKLGGAGNAVNGGIDLEHRERT